MKKGIVILTFSLLLCPAILINGQDLTPGKTSMLTPDYLFNPDPTMHVIDDRLYLFTSHDQSTERFIKGDFGTMFDYHAMSTTDLKTWVDHGSILSIHDVSWAKDNMVWDGDAGIEANGKYYAYMPFSFEIGVLDSDHPAGPYVDALGRPLVPHGLKTDKGEEVKGSGLLVSPMVFFDEGDPYLVFGHFAIYIVKLKPNMIEFAGPIQKIKNPHDYVESPMITKIDSRYYLTYSNGGMWGEQEFPPGRIMYCIADNPLGPYGEPAILQDIQINPDGQGYMHKYASSAHQALARYRGQWYFAYQRDSKHETHRHVCITKLDVNPDGSLGVIDPNNDPGVGAGPIDFILDAFAPYKREAEEFHARHKAQEELGIRQDYHFKMLDGSWLRFNRMDFEEGAGGCRISVSCEQDDIEGAVVEFRLDSVDGELIGSVPVSATDGKMNYTLLTAKVKKVPGIHDLFIVARNQGIDRQGHLFNINWFTFTRESRQVMP